MWLDHRVRANETRELVPDQLATTVVKTGGRLIKHARYYWLMLAGSHLTRRLFGSMVRLASKQVEGGGGMRAYVAPTFWSVRRNFAKSLNTPNA